MKSLNRNKIKTAFVEYKNFYPAEDYHQDFYKKNPNHYYSYLAGCGRVDRLKEIWK
jgi:peptide methionine sulfoxide reductase MsrA